MKAQRGLTLPRILYIGENWDKIAPIFSPVVDQYTIIEVRCLQAAIEELSATPPYDAILLCLEFLHEMGKMEPYMTMLESVKAKHLPMVILTDSELLRDTQFPGGGRYATEESLLDIIAGILHRG